MRKRFANKWYGKTNKLGFSLVEVLIAIAILALLAIPLAQSMISSAQLNSQSKNVGVASDMASTVAESLQATKLGNVLTEVNGYNTNSVGAEIFNTETGEGYSFLKNALKGYSVEHSYEVLRLCPSCHSRLSNDAVENGVCGNEACQATIDSTNITYIPVKKQSDVGVDSDEDVTSSIKTRTTKDNVVRTYFTGNEDDTYDFVLRDVHTSESNYDVLVHIEPEQELEIADIASMSGSDVVNLIQKKSLDADIAETFFQNHQLYCALRGTASQKTINDFKNEMTREITIDMRSDAIRGTVVITVKAVYTAPANTVNDADKTISKTIGSFTTNSTADLAEGVYLCFYPLRGVANGTTRDKIVVNNQDDLAITIYLIAMNDTTTGEYHPTLTYSALTPASAYDSITFCSNIDNDEFGSLPDGVEIKTLSNITKEQTLYEMDVKIYTHKDSAFDANGIFSPDDKYLLVNTNATLLDSSERFDINVDSEFGNPIPDPDEDGPEGPGSGDVDAPINKGYAEAASKNFTYDGTEKDVTADNGSFVEWTGTTKATDAGTYYAYAKPKDGHTWPNGTTGKRQVTWTISRATLANAEGQNAEYDQKEHKGYTTKNPDDEQYITATGDVTRTDAGYYIIYITPKPNYAWEDGSYNTKEIIWAITPKAITLTWATGEGKDTWQYDGKDHSGECTIGGIIEGDTCTPNYRDNLINAVGRVTAKVTSLSNENYAMPTHGTTHDLTVTGAKVANIVVKKSDNGTESLIYNGEEQTGVSSSVGVSITGTPSAIDAGTYTITATPLPGYTWDEKGEDVNDTAPRDFEWSILQKEVTVEWGTLTWDYDGFEHSTTCDVSNLVEGTKCDVSISNNLILDAGEQNVHATLENKNYKFPDNPTKDQSPDQTLTVKALPDSRYELNEPVVYDGQTHDWGEGKHIQIEGVLSNTEAGTYKVTIKPTPNHTWADGTKDAKEGTWTIKHAELAFVEWNNYCYTGKEITGVTGSYFDVVSGVIKATAQGEYTATVKPSKNYAWAGELVTSTITYPKGEQDTGERVIIWKIVGNTVVKPDDEHPILNFGDPITTFEYNGGVWSPLVSTIDGTLPLNDAVFDHNAYYTVTGTREAIDAGTYQATISLKDKTNSSWALGGTEDIVVTWTITKRKITVYTIPHYSLANDANKDKVTTYVDTHDDNTYAYLDNLNANGYPADENSAYPFVGETWKPNNAFSGPEANEHIPYLPAAFRKVWDDKSFTLNPVVASGSRGNDGDIWIVKDNHIPYEFDYQATIEETQPISAGQSVIFNYTNDCNYKKDAGVYQYSVRATIRDSALQDVTNNYDITYKFSYLIIDKAQIPEAQLTDEAVYGRKNLVYKRNNNVPAVQQLVTIDKSVATKYGQYEFVWEAITYTASQTYGTPATLTGKTFKLNSVNSAWDTQFTPNGVGNPAAIDQLNGHLNAELTSIDNSYKGWTTEIPTGITTSEKTNFSTVGTRAGVYVVYWRIRGDRNHEDVWRKEWYCIVTVAQAEQTITISKTKLDKCYHYVNDITTASFFENPYAYISVTDGYTTMVGGVSVDGKNTGNRIPDDATAINDANTKDCTKTITMKSNNKIGTGVVTVQAAATENYKQASANFTFYCSKHLEAGLRESLRYLVTEKIDGEDVTYDSTCTAKGQNYYVCTECCTCWQPKTDGGYTRVCTDSQCKHHVCFKTESIAAKGHNWSSSSSGGWPCTVGQTVVTTCSRCNDSYTTHKPAAYSKHTFIPISHDSHKCINRIGQKWVGTDSNGYPIYIDIPCDYVTSHTSKLTRKVGCCQNRTSCSECSGWATGYFSCSHNGEKQEYVSSDAIYTYYNVRCRCCNKFLRKKSVKKNSSGDKYPIYMK